MKRFIILYSLLISLAAAMPAGLQQIIAKSGIPKKDISIYIKEAGKSNRVVASLNADTVRTPASVIKVLTTYAAVLKLGFDYRWPTKFYTTGKLKGGVLNGDLLVKGFGDPTLSDKDLKSIVAQIKAKGIRKITGNIVIDRTYFKVGTKDNSGFDQHTYSPYNAMPDAMMFNERVSTICITPKQNSVSKQVPDASYRVVNNLKLVNKPCRGRYSWPSFKVDKSQDTPTVLLKGPISRKCGTRKLCQVITKPYKTFYYALKDALKQEGIAVNGGFRLNRIPKNAKELFTHYSRPLEKIIAKTAKKSNNLYARQILLLLGAKMYGAPSTLQKGRQAVEYILKSRGALNGGKLYIDNGCGLSRTSKLSAKLLARMYDHAYSKYGQRWMKTLSIAGVDGTIRKRFRGTVVRNRAWMKTGTLKRVKNIGGYVKSRKGRVYTVVILVNSKAGNWKASQLQNNIIRWLVNYKGRGVAVKPSSKSTQAKKISAATAKHTVQGTEADYYIQAGSFAQAPTKAYLSKMRALGFSYTVKNEGNHKVLIGPYRSETAARNALKKVRSSLNQGAFLTQNSAVEKRGTLLY
ncbi:D-alanyl-D-alanine carboxypeptidase/D-alanyl-D-alanine endopeptidase [Sulfurovum riftiae]|uniref:D-alanyl-D-alanine carboxypeptidase n=1 Tax=Sulfurovum riftiae TaxID=1630136 RepID=A0A151CHT1_9BACT|nr:D-alanyl-D-alanine carboxypeptidase/D-alanyl-D-alanine-endopeptidase [Sulfurovum riftiae]KYJ87102.1 D-alanyl-D-alanine carboxypeptidase [Sulfurovum riftiae]